MEKRQSKLIRSDGKSQHVKRLQLNHIVLLIFIKHVFYLIIIINLNNLLIFKLINIFFYFFYPQNVEHFNNNNFYSINK